MYTTMKRSVIRPGHSSPSALSCVRFEFQQVRTLGDLPPSTAPVGSTSMAGQKVVVEPNPYLIFRLKQPRSQVLPQMRYPVL